MSETINHNNSIDENVDPSHVSIRVIDSAAKLWSPKNQATKLTEFQSIIETKFNLKFATYNDFYNWSIGNFVKFWEEFWHYSKIKCSQTYHQVLDKPNETVDSLPFKWFDGALLNYAENLIQYNDEKIAIYSYGEAFKEIKKITFKELRQRIKTYQTKLREIGVKRGDRVVGYMPNCIEFIEAKLATISLGAVWSCASPDFGSQSVVERFKQISPRVIFSVSSVYYNGKKHDHVAKLNQVVKGVDSIEKVIIVPFCDDSIDDISSIPKSIALSDFLESDESDQSELTFEQVPFNHPLVILYSSGTTGTPKCIVHSHGGTLIQHLKEHLLFGNMSPNDVIFYYTTTAWMMTDWLMTSLATGATIVLFDGSPFLPHENVLWDLVDKLGITMFGTSAKWVAVLEDKHLKPKETHDLSTLKIIYSTGSPLKPNSFDYIYSSIKEDIVVGSITGGSDIISLFCGHNFNLPVHRGEIQCRHLGMAVECWNDEGKPVYNQCGELVCVKPFPSMPIYFFNDLDFKKYKNSYFSKYPGVWAHGDFCMINQKTGGVTMLGRSDGTLNPNGVRFGSADIYNIIETMPEIDDSLCVGQQNPNVHEEERVVLFVKLNENHSFDKTLVDKIKTKIRTTLSARHVPNLILQISEIPYTLNGKKVEVPVRRIIEGSQIVPTVSSLANPQSLDLFKTIPELNKW